MAETKMRVKELCVYPIKSLRGCSFPSITATPTGFSYDRRFMLQRVEDDKNMLIGKIYEMCLFTTELSPAVDPKNILVRYTLSHTFNKPDQLVEDKPLEIPLEPDWKEDGMKEREINMHSSPAVGYEMADSYNEWFSKRFGYGVRLVYIADNRRPVLGSVTPNFKPLSANGNSKTDSGWLGSVRGLIGSVTGYGENKENEDELNGIDKGIGFADVAPFMVINYKSYDEAAKRVGDEEVVNILKFRPNIIVEGADEAYEEDYWAELAIGDADTRMVLTSNCARCASINVDFDTGKQGAGAAGKLLKQLQSDRRVDQGMKYSPVFGRYGFLARTGTVAEKGEVEIKVGDVVTVKRRNEERTRFVWPGISTDS